MTLLQAIRVANDEYDRETEAFADTPELVAVVREQHDQIIASGVLTEIIDACIEISRENGEHLDIVMVAAVAFRAGMRAQRKYDKPDKTTTVRV